MEGALRQQFQIDTTLEEQLQQAIEAEDYERAAELRDELKNAQQETIDYLSALPDSFYKRPHFYRRLALWIMEIIPVHVTSEHGEQIQRTLEAARK